MDKPQKELLKTYYYFRGISVSSNRDRYKDYEYSKYALDNGIINIKDMPIGEKWRVFNNNRKVREYLAPHIDEYNKEATGFLRLLVDYEQTGDDSQVVNFIKNSEFYTEHGDGGDVEIYGNTIELPFSEEDVIKQLDLEYDYPAIQGYIGGYDYYEDSDELNYMQNYFDGAKRKKVEKIAKVLGYSDKQIQDFWEYDGYQSDEDKKKYGRRIQLHEFFEDNNMNHINETFLSELSEAKGSAQSEAAEEMMENFPFEFGSRSYYGDSSDSQLDINNTFGFIYEHNLQNIKTFDDFLSEVENHHEINVDNVHEATYQYENYDGLNNEIDRLLDDEIDKYDDPDSQYYDRIQYHKEVQNFLKKYGFTLIPNADDYIAVKKQTDKDIYVSDFGYDNDGENLQFEIELNYKQDLDKGAKTRTGWVPAQKLANMVDQREIPQLRENKLKNIIISEIKKTQNGK